MHSSIQQQQQHNSGGAAAAASMCVCVCTPMVYPDSIAVEYNYHEISEIIIPFTVETFFSLKKEETFLFVAPPHQMFFFFLRGGFGR